MDQFQTSLEAPPSLAELVPPRQTRPKPAGLRPATSYLDGLRGIAALLVYTYHYSMALDGKRLRYGYGSHNFSLLSLPVLRLVHSGPAMVAIFFTISGYVLSVGPLRHARQRRWDRLLTHLSGAMLTRPVRLLVPSVCLTVASLLLAWFGCYERAARQMCPPSADCDFYPIAPPRFTSARAQTVDWFGFVVRDLANPWAWDSGLRPASAYGLHLWTVAAELRCSMTLFAVLAALLPCERRRTRAGLWLAMVVFCALWQRWDMVAFLTGLGLAVGDAYMRALAALLKMWFQETHDWLDAGDRNLRFAELGTVVLVGIVSVTALSKAVSLYRQGAAVAAAIMRSSAL
ncbi:hypothetical protein Cob_v008304 [Colletotrichum orbiculare MAFF 240422]|uniref:Acyltransferase 3 domain-containing protein n=1 Tax=Colletotrichum orbiculare (strain 104-T / ATCC 96160 / CBS 514.97 / LARS 414 / MAFF 240422) TaxID=1213857 RepID=A0A484FKH6_COLOR|nr:hypothetical protein Cob_v008304 [Colletotrichum orbiculare MAFF 240422]